MRIPCLRFGSALVTIAALAVSARAGADVAPNPLVLGGYTEAFYQWNLGNPSNGITHLRGFDNRHDSFTLANVVLDAAWDDAGALGRVALQAGHTPSTYYAGEPRAPGAPGANATGPELWKHVQQAYAGYRFGPPGEGLTVTAGLWLSPIGPENMAVKDTWQWSRSNLFFGLPFYHAGVRASYPLAEAWALTLAVSNGWNAVVDGNDGKSVMAQVAYTRPDLVASALYFGGVERPRGAPEGRAWRHLVDAHATWHVTPTLGLLAHGNGGFEPNAFGTSAWAAGALAARVRVAERLFVAARGDGFVEHVADGGAGRASPIFWPAPWVASGTLTLDFRPHDRVSFRLEGRSDHAGEAIYFGGAVEGDGEARAYVPNRRTQQTITLGATTWF
jgi:hypothetical protein